MKITYANEKREKKIRELLEDGPKTTPQLAPHFDIRRNTLARHLDRSHFVEFVEYRGLSKLWRIK